MGIPILGQRTINIPDTIHGWIGMLSGIVGSVLWCTQFIWGWYGISNADKSMYSVLVLLLLCMAIAGTTVGNRLVTHQRRLLAKPYDKRYPPMGSFLRITLSLFVGVTFIIMLVNGAAITMDTTYATYATANGGYFNGFRQLTYVTPQDVNSLSLWADGLRQIIRALFLMLPVLIATWGGLSVLTAPSIGEAQGGIMALVAAFIVFFVVWIFKGIDVTLMTLTSPDVSIPMMLSLTKMNALIPSMIAAAC